MAACHIGGITLHQFAGIGKGEATLENCYKMAQKPAKAQIWRRCKHLIIDEISMIDGKYFEVNYIFMLVAIQQKSFLSVEIFLNSKFKSVCICFRH